MNKIPIVQLLYDIVFAQQMIGENWNKDYLSLYLSRYTPNGGFVKVIQDIEQKKFKDGITDDEKKSLNGIDNLIEPLIPNWRRRYNIESYIDSEIKKVTPKTNPVRVEKNKYGNMYSSYSGTDIIASLTLPSYITGDSTPIIIGNLQTITYSIHREKTPVRTLGRINPVNFCNGQRTIAGSMIFTVFNKNLVYEIQEKILNSKYSSPILNSSGISMDNLRNQFITLDEMPLFDVHIHLKNEYGNASSILISGITVVDEGQVMSVEDMITENTISYMATDIRPLREEITYA